MLPGWLRCSRTVVMIVLANEHDSLGYNVATEECRCVVLVAGPLGLCTDQHQDSLTGSAFPQRASTELLFELENFRLTSTSRLTQQTTPKVRFTPPNSTIHQSSPALPSRDHPANTPPDLHTAQQRTGARDASNRHSLIRFLAEVDKGGEDACIGGLEAIAAALDHLILEGQRLTVCEQQSSVICKHGVSMNAPFSTHHQG